MYSIYFQVVYPYAHNTCGGSVLLLIIVPHSVISQPFLKIDFWFGPKNSIKLCAEHFTTLEVIKYISVTGHKLFLIESANIFEMVPDRHVVTIIHRYEHAYFISFGSITFDLE